jgi:hypothetical protein
MFTKRKENEKSKSKGKENYDIKDSIAKDIAHKVIMYHAERDSACLPISYDGNLTVPSSQYPLQ